MTLIFLALRWHYQIILRASEDDLIIVLDQLTLQPNFAKWHTQGVSPNTDSLRIEGISFSSSANSLLA